MAPVKEPKGIGGWLILVAIGVVISPIRMTVEALKVYSELFNQLTFSQLVDLLDYEPGFVYFVFGELIINIVLIMGSVLVAYWFFTTNYRFPKFFIFVSVFSSLVLIADVAIGIQLFDHTDFDPRHDNDDREVIRQIVHSCIWVPYMLFSKRVRNTFVRQPISNQPQSSIVM